MAVELTMTFLVDWVYAVYSSLTLSIQTCLGVQHQHLHMYHGP